MVSDLREKGRNNTASETGKVEGVRFIGLAGRTGYGLGKASR